MLFGICVVFSTGTFLLRHVTWYKVRYSYNFVKSNLWKYLINCSMSLKELFNILKSFMCLKLQERYTSEGHTTVFLWNLQ